MVMIIAVVHSKIPLFSRSRCAWNSFRQKHNCVMTQFNAKWINLTLYTTENHTTPQYVLMPSLLTSCSKLKKAFTDSNQVWYSPVWSKWLFNHLVVWDQEICSFCGLRFELCGCSYDGHWRLTWSLTSGPVGLVEVHASWSGHSH